MTNTIKKTAKKMPKKANVVPITLAQIEDRYGFAIRHYVELFVMYDKALDICPKGERSAYLRLQEYALKCLLGLYRINGYLPTKGVSYNTAKNLVKHVVRSHIKPAGQRIFYDHNGKIEIGVRTNAEHKQLKQEMKRKGYVGAIPWISITIHKE